MTTPALAETSAHAEEELLYSRLCPGGNLDELIPTIARDVQAVRSIENDIRTPSTIAA